MMVLLLLIKTRFSNTRLKTFASSIFSWHPLAVLKPIAVLPRTQATTLE